MIRSHLYEDFKYVPVAQEMYPAFRLSGKSA